MSKQDTVDRLAPLFEGQTPQEIIRIAYEEFRDDLMMTTAFGYSGIVLLSFVKDVDAKIPIYFIDTGYHFEETLKLRLKIMNEWNIDIIKIANNTVLEQTRDDSTEKPYRLDPDMCCHQRKVEPLLDVMGEDTVWLSATRRDQSLTRANTKIIDIDPRGQIKISPLAGWTKDQCWNYIHKYNLPYNPLHDQFYPSIGCYPCTKPIDRGGDERSGRWRGSEKIECGLHIPGKVEIENDQN